MTLQRCTICSGMPPGCSAEQYKSSADALPPTWEGKSTRSWHVGCGKEGPCDSCTCKKGPITETQSRRINQCTCPSKPTALESEEAAQPEEFAIVPRKDHWHPLGLPLHGQMSLAHPLYRRQTGPWAYPGSPTGFCLFGNPAGNHTSLPSDGQGMIWVPVLDHCLDVPTTGPAQTLRPTGLFSTDWGALSECNAL